MILFVFLVKFHSTNVRHCIKVGLIQIGFFQCIQLQTNHNQMLDQSQSLRMKIKAPRLCCVHSILLINQLKIQNLSQSNEIN